MSVADVTTSRASACHTTLPKRHCIIRSIVKAISSLNIQSNISRAHSHASECHTALPKRPPTVRSCRTVTRLHVSRAVGMSFAFFCGADMPNLVKYAYTFTKFSASLAVRLVLCQCGKVFDMPPGALVAMRSNPRRALNSHATSPANAV